MTCAVDGRLAWRQRVAAPAAAFLAGGVGLGLLALRDPHRSGSYGHCPFLALTGRPCPLCGGLRAVSDLLHGNVFAALGSNALAVLLLLGGAGVWLGWTRRRWRGSGTEGPPLTSDPRLARVLAVGLILFCLLRWLPGAGGLLGPSPS